MAQGHRNGLHDRLAQAAEHQEQNGNALHEDDGHGGLPAEPHAAAQGKGDDRVDAHARSAGKRAVREHTHSDRHNRGTEAGRSYCGRRVDSRGRQNARVDDDDVRHGQKRRKAGAHLRCGIRAALGKLEERIHYSPFLRIALPYYVLGGAC